MDTAQWPQEIVVKPIEEIVTNTCPKPGVVERKVRPQKDQALNCPRCNSINTKFCYYNNYSLTQPRYFCKACRRYWTEGGTLRNIPVGGGSRKNKRSSSSSSNSSTSNSSSKRVLNDQSTTSSTAPNPKIQGGQDLNLAFPSSQGIRSFSELIQVPSIQNNKSQMSQISPSSACTTSPSQISALELISGISSRGLNTFMPTPIHQDPNTSYETVFPIQDFKPTLNFSLDGLGGGYGSLQGIQETNHNGRLLFPFEDMKQQLSTTEDAHHANEQNKENNGDISTGYWTGMLGGGSW